eukprot:GHUV01048282.1.p1 GENE.GHUV01048282.1~~GHUV01048282.1.p1  ORF type:complete len:110 (-),score=22.61 GHUV01048282.1:22-351(-)
MNLQYHKVQRLPCAESVLVQARERMRMVASAKRSRALEEKRRQAGIPLAKDDAVTKIQSMLRGHLWRSRTRREANQEQVFIGMKPQVGWKRRMPPPTAAVTCLSTRHLV